MHNSNTFVYKGLWEKVHNFYDGSVYFLRVQKDFCTRKNKRMSLFKRHFSYFGAIPYPVVVKNLQKEVFLEKGGFLWKGC